MSNSPPEPAQTFPYAPWQDHDRSALLNKRILIVEDEPIVAIDYCFLLKAMGAEPAACKSTNQAALDFLAANEVDAAIVDYRLRDDSSSKPLMRQLRESGIPFIVISANTPEIREWTGAACVLAKPITPDDLWAALSVCLNWAHTDRHGRPRRGFGSITA